ncbi:MAG TPA: RHS repeat-associated core domain-containing protein, partial [Blastocatellia bacterium]|nr:RHS repeat-associated core domain-containing protein [Blastocatellia bacterium]
PGNSGQIVSVTGTINGQDRSQTFTYDNVGRLLTATGLSTQGPWARRYEYDQYGNQTKVWDAVSGGSQLQNTTIEVNTLGAKTNRIASVNGTLFGYDASGNVTDDGTREYTYDAENRSVGVRVKLNGLSESYGYDAANHRVKKVVGAVVTHYIWEGDQVIAEYERGGNTPANGTRYYHQDRLSTRVITDGSGVVKGTTDHLPFGEEIGFTNESEKHKFTTYERDGIGLDYAVNRHYASQLGRFNQADPLGMGASSLTDPQSLNMYSYVKNDPVNYVDPSGLLLAEGGDCYMLINWTLWDNGSITINSVQVFCFGGGSSGGGSGGDQGGGGGGGGNNQNTNSDQKKKEKPKCSDPNRPENIKKQNDTLDLLFNSRLLENIELLTIKPSKSGEGFTYQFSDVEGANKILNGNSFSEKSDGFGGTLHKTELGETFKGNNGITDYRSKTSGPSVFGPRSLQVTIMGNGGTELGNGVYSDTDKYNYHEGIGGKIGHAGELVGGFFRNIFRHLGFGDCNP